MSSPQSPTEVTLICQRWTTEPTRMHTTTRVFTHTSTFSNTYERRVQTHTWTFLHTIANTLIELHGKYWGPVLLHIGFQIKERRLNSLY